MTELLYKSKTETPVGVMLIYASNKGIQRLCFTKNHQTHDSENDLVKKGISIQDFENQHIIQAKKELKEYFAKQRTTFSIQLDLIGTDFQLSVWESLMKIPYGKTISYQSQANQLNNPKAIRAVASANGKNPIPIIIPCHRVIGSNGKLTGYAAGLERKKYLLELENPLFKTPEFDFKS